MKRLFAILLSMLLIFGFVGCTEPVVEESTTDVIVEETTIADVEFNKNVVIDTELFAFYVEGAERNDEASTWSVNVSMENKTDKVLNFSWKEVFINNCNIDPTWSYGVLAETKDTTKVTFHMGNFEANDIEQVENLKFTLSITDEDGNILEDTEYLFSLNVSAEETTVEEETTVAYETTTVA